VFDQTQQRLLQPTQVKDAHGPILRPSCYLAVMERVKLHSQDVQFLTVPSAAAAAATVRSAQVHAVAGLLLLLLPGVYKLQPAV
jgi:hypothetical protein